MALILLNPGLRPLGHFDFKDSDRQYVKGGEIGKAATIGSPALEGYAYDVGNQRDMVFFQLDSFSDGRLCGLIDEGTSKKYGTLFGSGIGGNTGQGTGFGSQSTRGVVALGPNSILGSGKATIWHQAGLYGVTEEAFISGQGDAAVSGGINTSLFGTASGSSSAGKLTTVTTGNEAAWWIGREADATLVSTTNTAAGNAATTDFYIMYFPGPHK